MIAPSFFTDSNDVRLAVYTWGTPPTKETPKEVIVMLHGFPDCALFWEPVAVLLAREHYVVAYDMRGTGLSTPISGTAAYQYRFLIDDVFAVIKDLNLPQKIHLVGHDWGGLYGWPTLSDPRSTNTIASFSTLSPSLDHIGLWLRKRLLRPTPCNIIAALGQLGRNSLMLFFTLPLLPHMLWKSGLGARLIKRMMWRFEKQHFNARAGLNADAIRYLGIYRANLLKGTLLPKQQKVNIPVLALIAERDPFLPPRLFVESALSAENYQERLVDASHWAPLSQPNAVAVAIQSMLKQFPSA